MLAGHWEARITHVRGPRAPISAHASPEEGAEACAARARAVINRYIAFLEGPAEDSDGPQA